MNTSLADQNRQFEANRSARAFTKWARHRLNTALGVHMPDDPALEPFQKAAVAAMTGSDSALRRASSAFLDVVKRRTILGQLTGSLTAPPGAKIAPCRALSRPLNGWRKGTRFRWLG